MLIPIVILVALLLASLFAIRLTHNLGGGFTYDAEVGGIAKGLWFTAFAISVPVIFLIFGPAAMLASWPFFIIAPGFAFVAFKALDMIFVRKPRQERTITHADGSRAVVDGRDGTGYRRLAAPETRRESGVVAAIDKLLGD